MLNVYSPRSVTCESGLPPARQADRRGLQSRLQVLLLPLEGDALPGQPLPDGRRPARDLHPAAARVAARPGGHRRAGRAASRRSWASTSSSGPSSYVAAAPAAGPAASPTRIQTNGTLIDDEWAAFFKRAQVPGRAERRRPARSCTTPTASTRAARARFDEVMRGLALPDAARRRREHPVHRPRRQRRSPARGLPLLPRRAGDRVHPVHPDRRAGHVGAAADCEHGLGRARQRSASALPAPRATRSPSAPSARSSGAVPDRRLRRVDQARRRAPCSCRCSTPRSRRGWARRPSMCIFAETCGNALALEHNGDLYSCDHFVEPEHLLGNIQDGAHAASS